MPTIFGGTCKVKPPIFLTPFVGDSEHGVRHKRNMLGTREILERVRPLATNAELSRLLNLSDSRIPEIFSGKRKLQLEEAKILVEKYGLEENVTSPLSVPIARLMVLHVLTSLGLDVPEDGQVLEVAKDLAAFSMCADDPQWKGQIDALAHILKGMETRRRAMG